MAKYLENPVLLWYWHLCHHCFVAWAGSAAGVFVNIWDRDAEVKKLCLSECLIAWHDVFRARLFILSYQQLQTGRLQSLTIGRGLDAFYGRYNSATFRMVKRDPCRLPLQ